MTHEELSKLTEYDPLTGIFALRVDTLRRKKGETLGYPHKKGYIAISLGNDKYLAHRLAWFYIHGEWPTDQIDHINMNKTDNRLCNLRVASNAQNQWNTTLCKNNTSGQRGVRWDKQTSKWRVQVDIEGTHVHLGRFSDQAAAKNVCSGFLRKQHRDFYRGIA